MRFQSCEAETEAVVESIITEIATTEDVDPLTLPPLYGEIDWRALERAIGGPDGPERIVFDYADWIVELARDGSVTVVNTSA